MFFTETPRTAHKAKSRKGIFVFGHYYIGQSIVEHALFSSVIDNSRRMISSITYLLQNVILLIIYIVHSTYSTYFKVR